MAGLYDQWTNDKGELMHSFTILTTDIALKLKWLHTRMPVILTPDGVSRWLSDAKFKQVSDLLVAYEGDDLQWYPVDKKSKSPVPCSTVDSKLWVVLSRHDTIPGRRLRSRDQIHQERRYERKGCQ